MTLIFSMRISERQRRSINSTGELCDGSPNSYGRNFMKILGFPGARAIGKPRDWIPELDGECGTIFVTDFFNEQLGYNIMYSVYKPTEADIAAIVAGGGIRLGIHGKIHPVFQLGVLGPDLMKQLDYTEYEDLGPPL